jgi:hypothetical protein
LGVINGNLPAYTLYESLGFQHFGGNHDLWYELPVPPPVVALPAGYTEAPIARRDGAQQAAAAVRFTPRSVQDYAPVDPERWTPAGSRRLFMALIERMQGLRLSQAGVRDQRGELVGWYELHVRTNATGINKCHVFLDPAHSTVAPFLMQTVIEESLRQNPQVRLQVEIPSWENALLEAAKAFGCVDRIEYHALGVRL